MKKLLLSLYLSLLTNLTYADTTGNLVSQDFTTGWTNTGNSYHGNLTIAGHHNGTVESDSVSLNAEGINKESLNNGFSVTGSADVWFWNNQTQSVTQTIKTVDGNGEIITQNRTLSGSCATWNGCSYGSMTDTLIIGSNSQQDYDVNLKYSFSVPNQTSGHYGADLKNPYLSVTYTYIPPLDSATQTALFDMNETLTEDLSILDLYDAEILTEEFKQDLGVNYVNDFTGEVYGPEPPTDLIELEPSSMPTEDYQADTEDMTFQETFTESEPKEEFSEMESVEDSQDLQELQNEEQEPSLQAEQSLNEEQDTETETLTEEEQTTEAVADNKSNVSGEKKVISLAKSMEKIDAQVKDIGKNLQLKNLVKIKLMSDNNALLNYANIPFYQPKNIYLDQINIRDNRILYNDVTLVSYQQKDPIFQAQKELFEIRQEKQKLIRELQILKNG